MRVCFVAEGCYPYEVGGVSSWIHSIINTFPDIEFSLIAIVANRNIRGKFKYQLPKNLVSVYEVYLQDCEWVGPIDHFQRKERKMRLNAKQVSALSSLVQGTEVDWPTIFQMFTDRGGISVDRLLMSPDFMNVVLEFYLAQYDSMPFTDFLWTMRSIYLTLFLSLKCPSVEADIYHCVATGYAGIIGAMQKLLHPGSQLLVSEHGIYTREREEEIIRAHWVQGIFKDIWIAQFKKMSRCAYDNADRVTALFENARLLQIELGCPREKTMVTPNGINQENFASIPQKDPADPYFNIGAVLRVTPIKDVKTMITSFFYAHQKNPMMKLWIMGSTDEDPEYYKECINLVESLGATDIIFTGIIRTTEYIGKMDILLLTSISEGQPLTILEGFAAHKPSVATNVGNCSGLIYGESDDYGDAGIVVPVMNTTEIMNAILRLASNPDLCRAMGEVGYRRMMAKYKNSDMKRTYALLYQELYARMEEQKRAANKGRN